MLLKHRDDARHSARSWRALPPCRGHPNSGTDAGHQRTPSATRLTRRRAQLHSGPPRGGYERAWKIPISRRPLAEEQRTPARSTQAPEKETPRRWEKGSQGERVSWSRSSRVSSVDGGFWDTTGINPAEGVQET